jgi:hypothetical protein
MLLVMMLLELLPRPMPKSVVTSHVVRYRIVVAEGTNAEALTVV